MAKHLDDIVALYQAQTELRAAEEQLDGIPDWMQELHQEHSGYLAEITTLEEAVEGARHERRAAEVTIEDAQERLKRYQQQINQVSTQREYGALLHEIDTAKGEISKAEEQGLAAMAEREEGEKQLTERREGFSDLNERYQTELAKWDAEKPQIVDRIKILKSTIEEVRSRLPPSWLMQYDRVQDRYQGEGLAAVQEVERIKGPRIWHCGVCNYRVRPQVVVELRNNATLTPCDNCRRILYLSEEPAAEEVVSKAAAEPAP